MAEFWLEEKRVGLHSAVFRELVLWPKGLGPTLWRKAAGTAKVGLELGQPVLDETGLDGRFQYKLVFRPEGVDVKRALALAGPTLASS